jgi:poly-gamma-glutamate synthesis protein (capsule biosynthesis protein)
MDLPGILLAVIFTSSPALMNPTHRHVHARIPDNSSELLTFQAACSSGEHIIIGAVGDVLLHEELQRQAFASPMRYRSIWSRISHLLTSVDVTYANLEGPMASGLDKTGKEVPDPGEAYDGRVYSTFPRFNYHPRLAEDLRRDSVNIVSTANNHALDRGPLGVDRTIESLRKAELLFTGTRLQGDNASKWYAITESKGIRVAWLACSQGSNLHDPHKQVLRCTHHWPKDNMTSFASDVTALVTELAELGVDAIIVTPHWGKEYVHTPFDWQVRLGQSWLDAGATAVIGSHPHVVQPGKKYITKDGRETFLLSSLGNFASHQDWNSGVRSSAMVLLGLTKGTDGRTHINGVRYVPLHVAQENAAYFVEIAQPHTDEYSLNALLLGDANLQIGGELMTHPQCEHG